MIMTADLSPLDFPFDSDLTERALDIAVQQFADHGPNSTDMARVAAAVERGTGARPVDFRRAYPTRLDLVYAITLRTTRRFVLRQIDGFDADSPPIDRISRLIRAHIEFRWEHRVEEELRRAAAPALRSISSARYRELSGLMRDYRDHVRRLIEAAQSTGAVTANDAAGAAANLIATLDGILNWYEPSGGLSLSELGDVYVDLIIHHHLGAPRE
ncbi:TetR family transcriptional regulator [Murinocardiopsis flavida]|uniref:TetR family transcriptional regulator n=1 Tax=Murinocardiopsis flavida TaxID=645275 RepID=A0A2P8DH05_9ACTN|nr:TetR/AcrR family transcriptional regulator [Murinocardiopsis flavida]PSK96502.1 TetR family transcriptional regulator [Murinocardiopsis flavida]